jgi:hypothetical protein
MRGLDEKNWKVLAPISRARSTALEAPPAVPRCTPMRLVMETSLTGVLDLPGGGTGERGASTKKRGYPPPPPPGNKWLVFMGLLHARRPIHDITKELVAAVRQQRGYGSFPERLGLQAVCRGLAEYLFMIMRQ